MVKIKGLIVFEELPLREKIKGFLGIYRIQTVEYNGKQVFILKTDKFNDTVRKRFIRRRVNELYVSPETEKNIARLENEGFSLVLKKSILKKNIAEIVRKYALSSGVEKGKIILGLAVKNPSEILGEFCKIGDYIGEVYLFGKKNGKSLKAADLFYSKTGISVILKENFNAADCDVIVSEAEAGIRFDGFEGGMIYLDHIDEYAAGKTVKGMRLLIPRELRDIEADDAVIADMFGIPFKISGFITEKQKST